MSDAPERFVWPPKKPPSVSPTAHDSPTDSDLDPTLDDLTPPSAPHLARFDAELTTRAAPPRVLRRSWAHTIEREWLGLSRPPWSVRAAEAGWQPDRTDDYCPTCGQSVGAHELRTPKERHETRDRGPTQGPSVSVPKCAACRSQRRPWERCVRLGPYVGVLRDAIHELKFEAWRQLGTTLGRTLGEQLRPLLSEHRRRSRLVLLHMPTTFRRRIARGIDHTLVIARGVRDIIGGELARPIRRDHRPSQLDVAPSARARNVAGSFRARLGAGLPPDALVVLIDDVMTTGATMSAASRAVRVLNARTHGIPADTEAGAEPAGDREEDGEVESRPRVWSAVLGVTPTPNRRQSMPRPAAGPPEREGGSE